MTSPKVSHMTAAMSDRDCTMRCKSKLHGAEMTAALTKRAVTDTELASFIAWRCANCGEVTDDEGRTTLHTASSCGRLSLVRYLLRAQNAPINARDAESGCTALHRSVFYGQIHVAVELMKHGANVNIVDHMDLTAIDHAMKDRLPQVQFNMNCPCEVYVWGSNHNYTLGTGRQTSRLTPDVVDSFRKQSIFVKQVSLNKFHSLFLSQSGQAFSCGHGQGGRLGSGSEITILTPQPVRLAGHGHAFEICTEVSTGRDHSLFVMESGTVWSCGLNQYHQLGFDPPPDMLLSPKPLRLKGGSHTVIHVNAGKYHSVAWGPRTVVTWGLSGGQLGHDKSIGKTVILPKQVAGLGINKECLVVSVATSDGATVVATGKGHIYVLHEFQCRKIASRQLNLSQVSVIGGHLSPEATSGVVREGGGDPLRVLVLTTNGNVLLWQESSLQLTRCIFSLNRPIIVTSATLNQTQVLLTTYDGEAFSGEIRPKKLRRNVGDNGVNKTASAFHEFINRDECEMIRLKRIPYVHRAVSITGDTKGQNWAVVQTDTSSALTSIPEISESMMQTQMGELLLGASEDDPLHDVVFKVGFVTIPAHRFVIFKSEVFQKMYDCYLKQIVIEKTNPGIFKQLLLFMYTGTCDLLKLGPCPSELQSGSANVKNENNATKTTISQPDGVANLNLSEMSAFQVYSGKNKHKDIKNKIKVSDVGALGDERDPIRLLQECAKRFGVPMLQGKLDGFRYEDGFIFSKTTSSKMTSSASVPCWERQSQPDLCDVTLKSSTTDPGDKSRCKTNSVSIRAHKCVLAARLEYFNGMFMHSWSENSSNSIITLPFPHPILELIVNFLYTDLCPKLDSASDELDFICTVLVVSDQFFITRLRNICESVLAKRLTLKNVALLTQFSDKYNAEQLKKCCMQYISLNLPALLENRSLEILGEKILKDIGNYYCDFNEIMSMRVITPFSNAVSDEEVKFVAESFPVDLEEEYDFESSKKKDKLKKKSRIRKSSENEIRRLRHESENSSKLDIEIEVVHHFAESTECEEKPIDKSDGGQEKQMTAVLMRLNSIKIGISEVLDEVSYTKLLPKSQMPIVTPLESPNSAHSLSIDFPELSGVTRLSSRPKIINSPIADFLPKQKPEKGKLSQSQRKKLLAQAVTEDLDKTKEENASVKNLAWRCKEISENSGSFADILKSEQKLNQIIPSQTNHVTDSLKCSVVPNIIKNLKNVQASQDNLSAEMNQPCSSFNTKTTHELNLSAHYTFRDIIADERKQRENYSRMKSKALIWTQIEDKAIEDLEKFYNVSVVDDENISVSRVCSGKFAAPLWIQAK